MTPITNSTAARWTDGCELQLIACNAKSGASGFRAARQSYAKMAANKMTVPMRDFQVCYELATAATILLARRKPQGKRAARNSAREIEIMTSADRQSHCAMEIAEPISKQQFIYHVRATGDAFDPHLASGWMEERKQLGRSVTNVLMRVSSRPTDELPIRAWLRDRLVRAGLVHAHTANPMRSTSV